MKTNVSSTSIIVLYFCSTTAIAFVNWD